MILSLRSNEMKRTWMFEWNLGPSSTKRNTWHTKACQRTHNTVHCSLPVNILYTHAKAWSCKCSSFNRAHCTRAHAFDIEWSIGENNSQFKVQRPQPRITFITRRLHHIVRHSVYILCYRFHYKAHIHKYPDPIALLVRMCGSVSVVALRCRICWRQLESISQKNDTNIQCTHSQPLFHWILGSHCKHLPERSGGCMSMITVLSNENRQHQMAYEFMRCVAITYHNLKKTKNTHFSHLLSTAHEWICATLGHSAFQRMSKCFGCELWFAICDLRNATDLMLFVAYATTTAISIILITDFNRKDIMKMRCK